MYNQKQQSITNTSNFLKFILNLIQKIIKIMNDKKYLDYFSLLTRYSCFRNTKVKLNLHQKTNIIN